MKSAMKAAMAMVTRILCFLNDDQFRGSLGSSEGWGTKTVSH